MADYLADFKRIDLIYKTLNEVDFEVAVLLPKSLASSQPDITCPLAAHFHGGGLVIGTVLDPFFTAKWFLELAARENAIIVSPTYRLMPEARVLDIIDDIKDFWAWAHSDLPSAVAAQWPHITLDPDRTAVYGGILALQSAFLCPEAEIKVVMAQYPGLSWDVDPVKWEQIEERKAAAPAETHAIVDTYMAGIKPGAIRLKTPFPENLDLLKALAVTGRYRENKGRDEVMSLDYAMRTNKTLPPMWIAQGSEDRFVPKAGNDEMVRRIREAHPEVPLLYTVQPGDHGFDVPFGLDEPWVAEGGEFVKKYWP
ncbi:Alpha/beta hydrolase fold-3 [Pleurostoma richardsiae]|uniref:Alpha/beta hydrolase fold-3 n=1 Tax=Pleurostoma richardsiae TaxID=41990 RepID=A0AA38W0I6_9PEZI|nr:Alpha/beta hydrolase fold-3 [Pleurostoma richardsiae]